MKRLFRICLLICCQCLLSAGELPLEKLNAIPWKTDPPVIIDGDFSDWDIIPVSRRIHQLKATARAAGGYKGTEDCSGVLKFAWRQEGLYIAAWIQDNELVQQFRGRDCFRGDHLELFLDLIPGIDPDRDKFGTGQYHIGISPGDFHSIKPEIHIWFPAVSNAENHRCAAVQTANGWALEAFIAWDKPRKLHSRLGMEVYLSDTDKDMPDIQKHVLALGPKDWKYQTRRTLPQWILTQPDGKIPAAAYKDLQDSISWEDVLQKPKTVIEKNVSAAPPAGTIPVLSFSARWHLQYGNIKHYYGGYAHGLKIFVNGKEVTGKQLLNRPDVLTQLNGRQSPVHMRNLGFLLPYTNEFFQLRSWQNRFKTRVSIHDFELNLEPFWQKGSNTIRIEHTGRIKRDAALKNLRLSWQLPPRKAVRRAAPTGALPRIAPRKEQPVPYAVTSLSSGLRIELEGQRYLVKSLFSTPDGRWHSGTNTFFTHARKIEKKDELVLIHDTFTNLTKENLPIRQRHEVILPALKPLPKCYLTGLEALPSESRVHSFNSTTFAAVGKGGIGIFPVSQVFRLHSRNYLTKDYRLGLCDEQFAIAPGRSYTQTFAVLPVPEPDYWCFLNAARRFLNSNFQLQGPFGWRSIVCNWKWTDEAQREFIRIRGDSPIINIDTYASGQFDNPKDREKMAKAIRRFRRIFPDKKILIYFHDQINVKSDLGDSPRVIGQNGQPAFYGGGKKSRLFLPLDGTPMERANWKRLKCYLDDWKLDGIFWDEYSRSGLAYHYGKPWDGVSADIDGRTGRIRQLKSLVPLLKEPVQKRYIDEMRKRGKFICANGELHGYALEQQISSCAESEVRTNIVRVQLHTPIQYQRYMVPGMTYADHYLDMLDGLNHGILFWWAGRIDPPAQPVHEYQTLTEHMYPITPIELHSGYIIGKERIISAVSGTFGWDDDSGHQVHVYDSFGMKVPGTPMRTYSENGRTWTDLRLAENYSAVIVREKNK